MKDPIWGCLMSVYIFKSVRGSYSMVPRALVQKFWGRKPLSWFVATCWLLDVGVNRIQVPLYIRYISNYFVTFPRSINLMFLWSLHLNLKSARPRLCQGFLWGIATIYSPQVQAMGADFGRGRLEGELIKLNTVHHMSICPMKIGAFPSFE